MYDELNIYYSPPPPPPRQQPSLGKVLAWIAVGLAVFVAFLLIVAVGVSGMATDSGHTPASPTTRNRRRHFLQPLRQGSHIPRVRGYWCACRRGVAAGRDDGDVAVGAVPLMFSARGARMLASMSEIDPHGAGGLERPWA